MTGLFFLCCFLPLWRHFALCDQTTALPCCKNSRCHLVCHSADAQRKQALLALYFLIKTPPERGERTQFYFLREHLCLRDKKLSPKAKRLPLNDKAPLKVIPIYSCSASSRFPQGSSFSCSSSRGSGSDGCTTGAMLASWPVCSVIGLNRNGGWRKEELGLAQHNTKLHKLRAGSEEATDKNPTNSNTMRNLAVALTHSSYMSGS